MTQQASESHFTQAFLIALEESFEKVHGMYLDRGASIFETLATISAEEASQYVSMNCATIAAHVAHMTFYMDTLLRYIQGDKEKVDWAEIWNRVSAVTDAEWQESQQALRSSYEKIQQLAKNTEWNDSDTIGGAMAILMHNAYHLGEIRQMLCTIKNG